MKKQVRRYDRIEIRKDGREKTQEGYLKGRARVTRTGVFPYRADDGQLIMELRHPNEVFAKDSMDTLKLLPMQIEHKVVMDADNAKKYKCGHFGEDVQVDSPFIDLPYVVDTTDGVDAVENQGKEFFSCGYVCNLVEEPGIFEGQAYTHRQMDIRYNHVALTGNPRLGTELRLDSLPFAVQEDGVQTDKKEHRMKKIRIDTGLEYDAAEEVVVYVDSLTKKIKVQDEESAAMKKKMEQMAETMKEEKSKGDAALDISKADAKTAKDALKTLQDGMPGAIRKAAMDRADLMAIASQVMDEAEIKAIADKSDLEIRKAVILKDSPDAKEKLAEKADDATYITARYDAVVEKMEKDGSDALAKARAGTTATTGVRKDSTTVVADRNDDDDRAKMRKSRRDSWKTAPATAAKA